MQFFGIIKIALVILAWVDAVATIWALVPTIQKLLKLVRLAHQIFQEPQ